MTFVLFLHVAAAIFIVGPLTTATMVVPLAVRAGTEGLPLLRWLERTTWVYGLAALLVGGLGFVLVRDQYSWREAWLSIAAAMYLVAIVVVLAVLDPYIRRSIKRVEGGQPAPEPGTYLAASGVVALLWIAVLALMVFQPGHHGG